MVSPSVCSPCSPGVNSAMGTNPSLPAAAPAAISGDSQAHQFHREKSPINDRKQWFKRVFSSCHFYRLPAGKPPGTIISATLPVMPLLPVLQSAFSAGITEAISQLCQSKWMEKQLLPLTNIHTQIIFPPLWPIRIFTITIPATLPGEP